MRSTLPVAILLLSSACATVAPPPPALVEAPDPAPAAIAAQEPALAYPATRRTDQVDPQFGAASPIPTAGSRMTSATTMKCAPGSTAQNKVTNALPRDAAAAREVQGADDRTVRLRAVRRAAQEGRPLLLHPQRRASEPVGALRPRQRRRRGRAADRSQRLVQGRRHRAGRMEPERGRQAGRLRGPGRRHRLAHGQGDRRRHRPAPRRRTELAQVRRRRRLGQGRQRLLLLALPRARRGPDLPVAQATNQKVYFHKLGTAADRPTAWSIATPDQPDYGHGATISEDGRWLVITTSSRHRRPLRSHADRSQQAATPGRVR